jgi:FMN phosphatase YigB (HAD superfamily)
VAHFVDAFVSSVDTHVRKPDLRIFEAALRAIACPAGEAVVVSNSERTTSSQLAGSAHARFGPPSRSRR